MKLVVLLALVALVFSQNLASESGACAVRAKLFYNQVKSAVEQNGLDSIIDSIEKVSETVPSVLRACGAEEEAAHYEHEYPAVCTKLLAREAKLLVKIMKLYAEDQEKNEKQILLCNFDSMKIPPCLRLSTRLRCKRSALSWLSNTWPKLRTRENAQRELTDFLWLLSSWTMTWLLASSTSP